MKQSAVTYTGVVNVSTALATFACKRKPLTVYLHITFETQILDTLLRTNFSDLYVDLIISCISIFCTKDMIAKPINSGLYLNDESCHFNQHRTYGCTKKCTE